MTEPGLRVAAGAMLAFRIYDVAYAIDLARVEALGAARTPEAVGRLRLTRAEAKAIALPDPPVEIGLGPVELRVGGTELAAEAMAEDKSISVVNVDATSHERGQRTPVIASFREDGSQTIGPNRLVVRPYPGFPLRDATQYALVITDRVRTDDGGHILRDIRLTFTVTFPEGEAGDAARPVLPRALQTSHDRTRPVSRTIEAGPPHPTPLAGPAR